MVIRNGRVQDQNLEQEEEIPEPRYIERRTIQLFISDFLTIELDIKPKRKVSSYINQYVKRNLRQTRITEFL